MTKMTLNQIGTVQIKDGQYQLIIDPSYRKGLTALKDFSHLVLFYWADQNDRPDYRQMVFLDQQLYRQGPTQMGVFATRSAYRPNPLLTSTVAPLFINEVEGIIDLPYLDALDGTPLLDIKPYTPSIDRVNCYKAPAWCQHWPQTIESAGDFPWEKEFLF